MVAPGTPHRGKEIIRGLEGSQRPFMLALQALADAVQIPVWPALVLIVIDFVVSSKLLDPQRRVDHGKDVKFYVVRAVWALHLGSFKSRLVRRNY